MTTNQNDQKAASGGAERRREKRYEVQLDGQFGVEGKVIAVRLGDISASGALLLMADPPLEGTIGDLWIAGFGDLEVEVAYCGSGMCGVMFTHPTLHRDKLLKWLTEDATPNTGASP